MSSPVRQRRLQADYQLVMREMQGHPYVRVQPVGPPPPERYLVTYIPGLRWDPLRNEPVVIGEHVVEIYLHENYPRQKPRCTMKTEVFHPNIGSWVCIGDHWAAGETLVDVIVQIGRMLQYEVYNVQSPVNPRAAMWARENPHRLPLASIPMYQPEPTVQLGPARPRGGRPGASAQDDDIRVVLRH